MNTRLTPRPERRDGYLARAFDDDRYAWTRSAHLRRRLVLVEAGLLAALLGVTMVAVSAGAGWSAWFVGAWTVGLLAFLPVHSLLNASIRGLYDRSGRTIDEHQRQLRERSHAAVRGASVILTLAAWSGAVAVASAAGHTRLGLATGFLLWFAATLLPYWHLGWTLPDESETPAP